MQSLSIYASNVFRTIRAIHTTSSMQCNQTDSHVVAVVLVQMIVANANANANANASFVVTHQRNQLLTPVAKAVRHIIQHIVVVVVVVKAMRQTKAKAMAMVKAMAMRS
jgi:hypothetical protein